MLKELTTDILIIGAGPAGLTAALYAARANKKVLVLDGKFPSWITTAHHVENYPGIKPMPGTELLQIMREQALSFGAEIIQGDAFEAMLDMDPKMVTTREHLFTAKVVILATGKGTNQKLIPNETEFLGRGVSYCAVCDGALFKGKKVAVYGVDQEAEHDADYLKGLGCEVRLIMYPDKILKINGTDRLTSFVVQQGTKEEEITAEALFIIQAINTNVFLEKIGVALTVEKKILVNQHMATNISGVFAAGDITGHAPQVAVATGQGTLAALSALKYLR